MLRFALPMNMRRLTIPVVKVLFIAGTAGLVSLLTFYISVRSLIFGNEVKVPDLHGHDVVASRRVLTASSLSLVIVGEEYDPVVPAGEIIRQTPPSGASIKTQRKIKVVVSRGTEVLLAPDLAGEGERKALLE
ncbi:MAG: PASTA domain-containing protein, partial [Acidobacteria bacterium]|nr:PASTA domain-containing protein [Acidobacteriota bacterium]